MRVVKQRLIEMLPELSVFLDVDDLNEGKGAEFVDASHTIVVFCSEGYFRSANCMVLCGNQTHNGQLLSCLPGSSLTSLCHLQLPS